MSNDYVGNAAWVRPAGRPDTIDEVADQFERPAAAGPEAFWNAGETACWRRAPRGWRGVEHRPARVVERRAGRAAGRSPELPLPSIDAALPRREGGTVAGR